jgi:hypothetical protein
MTQDPRKVEAEVRTLIDALTASTEPAAFEALLALSQYLGECLGRSARTLAESQSWGGVAGIAGTTKQAAWSRWHH